MTYDIHQVHIYNILHASTPTLVQNVYIYFSLMYLFECLLTYMEYKSCLAKNVYFTVAIARFYCHAAKTIH